MVDVYSESDILYDVYGVHKMQQILNILDQYDAINNGDASIPNE